MIVAALVLLAILGVALFARVRALEGELATSCRCEARERAAALGPWPGEPPCASCGTRLTLSARLQGDLCGPCSRGDVPSYWRRAMAEPLDIPPGVGVDPTGLAIVPGHISARVLNTGVWAAEKSGPLVWT